MLMLQHFTLSDQEYWRLTQTTGRVEFLSPAPSLERTLLCPTKNKNLEEREG